MQKNIYKIKNTQENKNLVRVITIGLIDLRKEISIMSEDEIKIENHVKY